MACRKDFKAFHSEILRQRDSETAESLSISIKQCLPAHTDIGWCAEALLTGCCQRPISPTGLNKQTLFTDSGKRCMM